MSAALRMLHAERRKHGIDDDIFRAILLGQTGSESSKGITFNAARACVEVMRKDYPIAPAKDEPKTEWRKASDDMLVRKIYKLWGILKRGDVVNSRYPDAFVKKMTKCDRAEFCTPAQCNMVIEALKGWGEREGLGDKIL